MDPTTLALLLGGGQFIGGALGGESDLSQSSAGVNRAQAALLRQRLQAGLPGLQGKFLGGSIADQRQRRGFRGTLFNQGQRELGRLAPGKYEFDFLESTRPLRSRFAASLGRNMNLDSGAAKSLLFRQAFSAMSQGRTSAQGQRLDLLRNLGGLT